MNRRLEEMESKNHAVMKIVKRYCEQKKKKRMIMRGRSMAGMQVVGLDSNGKPILVQKRYSEAKKEQKLRQEEERRKKIADGEPEKTPPVLRPPRWSDEIMAVHLWRGVCRSNGMAPQKYQLRQDYRNMNRHEIMLDLLFRKVYKAKEEAAATTTTTTA